MYASIALKFQSSTKIEPKPRSEKGTSQSRSTSMFTTKEMASTILSCWSSRFWILVTRTTVGKKLQKKESCEHDKASTWSWKSKEEVDGAKWIKKTNKRTAWGKANMWQKFNKILQKLGEETFRTWAYKIQVVVMKTESLNCQKINCSVTALTSSSQLTRRFHTWACKAKCFQCMHLIRVLLWRYLSKL